MKQANFYQDIQQFPKNQEHPPPPSSHDDVLKVNKTLDNKILTRES